MTQLIQLFGLNICSLLYVLYLNKIILIKTVRKSMTSKPVTNKQNTKTICVWGKRTSIILPFQTFLLLFGVYSNISGGFYWCSHFI